MSLSLSASDSVSASSAAIFCWMASSISASEKSRSPTRSDGSVVWSVTCWMVSIGVSVVFAGAELRGHDARALGDVLEFELVLYPEGDFHGAGNLLELLHVHLGKGQQQHEEAHEQRHEIGEGRHPCR
jgi:hypothetical protein